MSLTATANNREACELNGLPGTDLGSGAWLADPEQLVSWQGRLVSFCNDINNQLSQIHSDLSDDHQTLKLFSRGFSCESADSAQE